jgi:hypothetical protein
MTPLPDRRANDQRVFPINKKHGRLFARNVLPESDDFFHDALR